jgi:hypothetical protein
MTWCSQTGLVRNDITFELESCFTLDFSTTRPFEYYMFDFRKTKQHIQHGLSDSHTTIRANEQCHHY